MLKVIDLEANGPVAVLRLNKPPINALDEEGLCELVEAVEQIESDPAMKVVIIASAIKSTFCAGGDLKYWPWRYANQANAVSNLGQHTFAKIEHLTKPTIAAIRGAVIGDGLSLALACDIRLASETATFQLPEVSYGFIPGWGTIGRLVEAVGTAVASELLFLGDPISAARAQDTGLVNRVLPPEELTIAAEKLATRIAAQPPQALRFAKAAVRGTHATSSPDRIAWEARCFASVWGSPEWEQGLRRLFRPRLSAEEHLE